MNNLKYERKVVVAQSIVRRKLAYKIYLGKLKEWLVGKVQNLYRRHLARGHLKDLIRNKACISIQCKIRGYLAKGRLLKLRQNKCAVTIQKHIRRYLGAKKCRNLQIYYSATTVQKVTRGHLSRKKTHILRLFIAARKIQSQYRGYIHRKDYPALRTEFRLSLLKYASAIIIQCFVRQYFAFRKLIMLHRLKKKKEFEHKLFISAEKGISWYLNKRNRSKSKKKTRQDNKTLKTYKNSQDKKNASSPNNKSTVELSKSPRRIPLQSDYHINSTQKIKKPVNTHIPDTAPQKITTLVIEQHTPHIKNVKEEFLNNPDPVFTEIPYDGSSSDSKRENSSIGDVVKSALNRIDGLLKSTSMLPSAGMTIYIFYEINLMIIKLIVYIFSICF